MVGVDRRQTERGRYHLLRDLLYSLLRAIGRHASNFYTAFGIFLISGAALAIAGTWAFVEVAETVREGETQAFDNAVLTWMAEHRLLWLERSLIEITALGDGVVVMVIALIAALFLSITSHRYSAFLLLLATAGGLALNGLLKQGFARPRPDIFPWVTEVYSSSFPSGHAMTAAIVYATVAYLAARLEARRWMRYLTMTIALILILLICVSRLYLGVHYPSDVLAGLIIGFAWAGFCMAGLEAARVFAERYGKKRVLEQEQDLTTQERRAAGLET
ncbi:MAG TPA: phosphatase PAP2 family protein [Gemmatimonadaceae bacterium]|nr:phosphatase PAP2 family protein [Gemmatimonadaceae bacterium]